MWHFRCRWYYTLIHEGYRLNPFRGNVWSCDSRVVRLPCGAWRVGIYLLFPMREFYFSATVISGIKYWQSMEDGSLENDIKKR